MSYKFVDSRMVIQADHYSNERSRGKFMQINSSEKEEVREKRKTFFFQNRMDQKRTMLLLFVMRWLIRDLMML